MTGSRILVVEDDARLAATLDRVLTAEGHHVELVADGLEALRQARGQPFDLVVLDVMLPSLDGVGVCRRLRATAQVPILMLLLVVPIGANHGPVAWMTNVALPIALIVLLRKPREALT
jgi:CheY-like chemotaxis protein